jgi:hypothetical protein
LDAASSKSPRKCSNDHEPFQEPHASHRLW